MVVILLLILIYKNNSGSWLLAYEKAICMADIVLLILKIIVVTLETDFRIMTGHMDGQLSSEGISFTSGVCGHYVYALDIESNIAC